MTFALVDKAKATRDRSVKKLYSDSLPEIIDTFHAGRAMAVINTSAFPDDGSFMKASQVQLWCRIFAVPAPAGILRRTWASLDAIVAERNGVAHGSETASEIGRRYTEGDMRTLIANWRHDWTAFLTQVGTLALTRDFYRVP
jgi:hypothetical protein